MVTWIVVAVVVLSLMILVAAVLSVVGRLAGLQRAGVRLQRRQTEAAGLQQGAEQLQETLTGLQERAEVMSGKLAVIAAARGDKNGKHSS